MGYSEHAGTEIIAEVQNIVTYFIRKDTRYGDRRRSPLRYDGMLLVVEMRDGPCDAQSAYPGYRRGIELGRFDGYDHNIWLTPYNDIQSLLVESFFLQ